MDHSVEVQMLNALEFFHYSYRFQNHLFIFSLSNDLSLSQIITDLRILNAAKIQCIVILNNDIQLAESIAELNSRGYPFEYLELQSACSIEPAAIDFLRDRNSKGGIPVIGLSSQNESSISQNSMDEFTLNLARHFIVDKVFFLSTCDGLEIDGRFISHLTPQEAQKMMERTVSINIGRDRLTSFIQNNLDFGFEIVLLKGESGSLFQEIFTHRGIGTLLTNDYPNIIRRGRSSDVMDITLLLKPYVSSGSILPVTEDAIAGEVQKYYVYTVNNSIVAIAKLTDHGNATELAKFCTLPRYQGKGRARELAESMIETVKKANKDYIFALSIEPKMAEFFNSLGFVECDRESLPENWKKQYDMRRKSKAFKLILQH